MTLHQRPYMLDNPTISPKPRPGSYNRHAELPSRQPGHSKADPDWDPVNLFQSKRVTIRRKYFAL
jgi:hypothetical protein